MYSQAIAGADTDATLFGNRSAAYLAAGMYQEAILDAQKATTLVPTWPKGFYRRAAACGPESAGVSSGNGHATWQMLVVLLHFGTTMQTA